VFYGCRSVSDYDNGVHNLTRGLTHGWTERHTHVLLAEARHGVRTRVFAHTNLTLLTINTITGDPLTGIPSWELM
jgi:hypothetical protein